MGVVTALEILESIEESDEDHKYPPTLTIWRGEEPPRFGMTNLGARGALGRLSKKELQTEDHNGITVKKAMEECGLNPVNLAEPSVDFDRMDAFFETHPEQGRVLENTKTNVGIVTNIRAPVRHQVQITGQYDHSGAAPMNLRRDALVGASKMISSIHTMAWHRSKTNDVVATVGDINAVNGQLTAVCGEVTFPIDLREGVIEPSVVV